MLDKKLCLLTYVSKDYMSYNGLRVWHNVPLMASLKHDLIRTRHYVNEQFDLSVIDVDKSNYSMEIVYINLEGMKVLDVYKLEDEPDGDMYCNILTTNDGGADVTVRTKVIVGRSLLDVQRSYFNITSARDYLCKVKDCEVVMAVIIPDGDLMVTDEMVGLHGQQQTDREIAQNIYKYISSDKRRCDHYRDVVDVDQITSDHLSLLGRRGAIEQPASSSNNLFKKGIRVTNGNVHYIPRFDRSTYNAAARDVEDKAKAWYDGDEKKPEMADFQSHIGNWYLDKHTVTEHFRSEKFYHTLQNVLYTKLVYLHNKVRSARVGGNTLTSADVHDIYHLRQLQHLYPGCINDAYKYRVRMNLFVSISKTYYWDREWDPEARKDIYTIKRRVHDEDNFSPQWSGYGSYYLMEETDPLEEGIDLTDEISRAIVKDILNINDNELYTLNILSKAEGDTSKTNMLALNHNVSGSGLAIDQLVEQHLSVDDSLYSYERSVCAFDSSKYRAGYNESESKDMLMMQAYHNNRFMLSRVYTPTTNVTLYGSIAGDYYSLPAVVRVLGSLGGDLDSYGRSGDSIVSQSVSSMDPNKPLQMKDLSVGAMLPCHDKDMDADKYYTNALLPTQYNTFKIGSSVIDSPLVIYRKFWDYSCLDFRMVTPCMFADNESKKTVSVKHSLVNNQDSISVKRVRFDKIQTPIIVRSTLRQKCKADVLKSRFIANVECDLYANATFSYVKDLPYSMNTTQYISYNIDDASMHQANFHRISGIDVAQFKNVVIHKEMVRTLEPVEITDLYKLQLLETIHKMLTIKYDSPLKDISGKIASTVLTSLMEMLLPKWKTYNKYKRLANNVSDVVETLDYVSDISSVIEAVTSGVNITMIAQQLGIDISISMNVLALAVISSDPDIDQDEFTEIKTGKIDPVSWLASQAIIAILDAIMDNKDYKLLKNYIAYKIARYIVRDTISDTVVYKTYVAAR